MSKIDSRLLDTKYELWKCFNSSISFGASFFLANGPPGLSNVLFAYLSVNFVFTVIAGSDDDLDCPQPEGLQTPDSYTAQVLSFNNSSN